MDDQYFIIAVTIWKCLPQLVKPIFSLVHVIVNEFMGNGWNMFVRFIYNILMFLLVYINVLVSYLSRQVVAK